MSDPNADAPTPAELWRQLGARASTRKRRLHACGCFRRLLADEAKTPELVAWVEMAEQLADGLPAEPGPEIAGRLAPRTGDAYLATLPDDRLNDVWEEDDVDAEEDDGTRYADPATMKRLRVLEEIIGPTPVPVFSPSWRTDTAVALARQMYESREFGAMPILADALQDAGCDSDPILNHCRSEGPHVRGCWVVDLVLGMA